MARLFILIQKSHQQSFSPNKFVDFPINMHFSHVKMKNISHYNMLFAYSNQPIYLHTSVQLSEIVHDKSIQMHEQSKGNIFCYLQNVFTVGYVVNQ